MINQFKDISALLWKRFCANTNKTFDIVFFSLYSSSVRLKEIAELFVQESNKEKMYS